MVTSVLARGGSERQMLATAEGLIRRGYQVEVFCFDRSPDGSDFTAEFSRLGIRCRNAFEAVRPAVQLDAGEAQQSLKPYAHLVDHLDVQAIGNALACVIKDFRPEIVHCWSDLANSIGGLVAVGLGVPKVVLAQRNMPLFRNIDGPEPYACRDSYRLLAPCANVTMLSNSVAGVLAYAKWLDLPNDRIKVLYNGFLPSEFHIRGPTQIEACRRLLGLSSESRVVGAVMRFAAEKDPRLWVDAAAAIAAARPDTCFVLAGYGELEEQARQAIESLGLTEQLSCPAQPRMSV